MSYLFSGMSDVDRRTTAESLNAARFTPEEPSLADGLDLGDAAIAVPRIMTRSVAKLGLAADAIPTALGSYYGVDNPWWHKHITESLLHTREELTPNPQTTHSALRIADQVAGMFSDFAISGFNPGVFSAMTAGEKITESLAQGKSLGTSLDLGAIEGVESLGFTKLAPGYALRGLKLFSPGTLAKEIAVPLRVQGAVTGAAQGMGIASAGEEARKQVLSAAGYPEEAAQHNWDNPDSLIMAGLFSGVSAVYTPKSCPHIKTRYCISMMLTP